MSESQPPNFTSQKLDQPVTHATQDDTPIDLSVVIGSVASARSIRGCIASIIASCATVRSEIIVVDASTDETASLVRQYFPQIRLISLPPGTLTPILWSTGIAAARGSHIATTTGHCAVPPAWARELMAALDSAAAGAGGPIRLRSEASLVDQAVYFLRYSAFLPNAESAVAKVPEIAGDNAMYARSVFDENPSALTRGFWEVEIHSALRETGSFLLMVPRASIEFGDSFPLGLITRHRFLHGKHYGAWRVSRHLASVLRVVVAAPVVPLVLLFRIARRVLRNGSHRLGFALASPIILWLAAAWAAGEAVGALQSREAARERPKLEAARAHRD
jgi:glycosyltransferase involved in cell wall biosynthesis